MSWHVCAEVKSSWGAARLIGFSSTCTLVLLLPCALLSAAHLMSSEDRQTMAKVVVEAEERVLFIGTQFSILYTSMYSPAEAATPRA